MGKVSQASRLHFVDEEVVEACVVTNWRHVLRHIATDGFLLQWLCMRLPLNFLLNGRGALSVLPSLLWRILAWHPFHHKCSNIHECEIFTLLRYLYSFSICPSAWCTLVPKPVPRLSSTLRFASHHWFIDRFCLFIKNPRRFLCFNVRLRHGLHLC